VTADQTIAVVAVASGAFVGLAGIAAGYFTAKGERSHSEKLARSTRLHSLRAEAYGELAVFLERQRMYIQRVEPMMTFGEPLEAPETPRDEEWMELMGRTAIASSEEVREAVDAAGRKTREWEYRVMEYRRAKNYAEGKEGADIAMAMHNARQDAYAAIDAAEQRMRDELAAL